MAKELDVPTQLPTAPPIGEALRLAMKGVSKRYGAVHALKNVDFELRRGEVMALLGENGAGKSTLVKILAGLVTRDAGEVEVDGEAVDLNTSAKSQAAGVAVVQQEFSLVGPMTVGENLVLGQRHAGRVWWPRTLRRDASELLAMVGLNHVDPGATIEELTVAEKQLLEIARVLARDAKIVIFDEPTAALADAEIDRVLGVVRELADRGRSVIYVTHRLAEVFRIADRVAVFRDGKSLPPVRADALDVPSVIEMMLGRELGTMFPARATRRSDMVLEVDELLVPGLARPVSFEVREGEIFGITGQIGSGASAVVQGIAGAVDVLGGTVRLRGEQLSFRTRASGIARGIAYCSADRKYDGIFANVSILQNLSSPWLSSVARGGWVTSRDERAKALRSCQDFALDPERLRSPAGTLSGGNQQKVALGKWLGTNPAVLLVEEPTRGVDVGARAEIYGRLRRLCETGVAIVICSSDTAEVFGLSDTITTFYKGTLTATRPYAEWTEAELVREAMHQEVAA
jgi:ribose transport system ATP-binding protein